MEEKLSPLAKGILDGLDETLQDAQGIPVDGMRKTTVYIDTQENKSPVPALDTQAHEKRYIRNKPNAAAV